MTLKINTEYSGLEFKNNVNFNTYIVLNKYPSSNGFGNYGVIEYKLGVIVNKNYKPNIHNNSEIFFVNLEINKYIKQRFNKSEQFIYRVIVPNDAKVYIIEDNLYKADKVVICELEKGELTNFFTELSKKYSISNGYEIKYITPQPYDIKVKVVKENGYNIKYIEDQTEELCMFAVKNNGLSLQFVNDKTEKVCKEAIINNCNALKFVENQTDELCYLAINQSKGIIDGDIYYGKYGWTALEFVKNQTPEICIAAIKNNYKALQFVKIKLDYNVYLYYVTNFHKAIKYIPEDVKTEELIKIASNHKKNIEKSKKYTEYLKSIKCMPPKKRKYICFEEFNF